MKVYLSGPIKNNPSYRALFDIAERNAMLLEHEPVNPVKIGDSLEIKNPSVSDFMKADIKALLECEGIYMISGWKKSKGACLEKQIAEACGLVWINP